MIALQILDIKNFTSQLFLQETFDGFCLEEAEFQTRYTISMDGYLTVPENGRQYAGWDIVRPLAFQILKGRELPHSFHITLRLSDENMKKTLSASGLGVAAEDVGGLFLNLRFDGKNMTAVTGCSQKSFSLDRSLEKEWDRIIRLFLRRHQIPAEEL